MYDALKVPELVSEIFSHYFSSSKCDQAVLFSLARTCKSFTEPALNRLWEKQDTLNNILKCLPSECWEETIESHEYGEQRTITIVRDVRPEEWNALTKNGGRIRQLVLASDIVFRKHPTNAVLEMLSKAFLPGTFLPHIRHLVWSFGWADGEDTFQYLPLFIHSRLIHLELDVKSAASIELAVGWLEPLASLRHLSIDIESDLGQSEDPELAANPRWTDLVMNLSHIRYLSLPTFPANTFHHLAQLPGLRDLHITSVGVADSEINALPGAGISADVGSIPSFRSLVVLSLSCTTPSMASQILAALGASQLGKLYLGLDTPIPLDCNEVARFYASAASRCNAQALKALSIGSPYANERKMPDPPIGHEEEYAYSGATLECFLPFSNLVMLSLEAPAGFLIDDAQLWTFARSWPRIQSLHLRTGSESSIQYHPQTTLDALRAFATHCPQLDILTLAIDATTVPPFEAYSASRVVQSTLRVITLVYSPIRDSAEVARFLSSFYTSIDHLSTRRTWRGEDEGENEEEEEDREYHEKWKRVEKLLPLLVAVRREEQVSVS
ncbi:hypothetical protein MKEN_00197600 [Mycena kentingensis (nom. inval.)]|nr:hypothetical protein MKEN_00197600 [Mycena kentingensis (nom. inval.)]